MQGFNVTRELAARLIDKSLRTIDRYLKSGKIRYIKVDGRTWLSREDVLRLAGKSDSKEDILRDNDMSFTDDEVVDSQNTKQIISFEYEKLQDQNNSLQVQLDKNKNLLALALKKIKLLKDDLNNSVSKVEHQTKLDLLKDGQQKYVDYIKKMDFHYKTQQKKYQVKIKTINDKLDSEKLNKLVIAFILALILIIQPFIIFFLK